VSQPIKNSPAADPATTSTTEATARVRLDPGPTGTLVYPGDPGWDHARAPWVINVDQQPAAIALVRSVDDVSAVVTSAARSGLKVIAQGTGHGALQVGSLSRTVLVRTTALNDVDIKPAADSVGRVRCEMAGRDPGCCRARARGSGRFGGGRRYCCVPAFRWH
jgi:FAD/FMN-containing dehydrogenase